MTGPGMTGPAAGTCVQGTVSHFDTEGHHGSVLLDDGTPVDFPASAFVASGLRLLRVGQRVRMEHGPDGAIVRVTLPTLP